MKVIKSIALLFLASMFTVSVSAQASNTKPAAKPASSSSTSTTTTTTTTKPAASTTDTKANTDKVNPSLHGPKNETVYTGPKGGNYYMKDGKKVYLKK